MSERLKKNLHLLHVLSECKRGQRNKILDSLNSEQINAICECIDNFLSGNVDFPKASKNRLRCKKVILRKLRDKKVNKVIKKKLLIQHGGFLPSLLIPILTIAGSLLGNL